jgi:hypothetical protein
MRGGWEFRCEKTAARMPVVADIDRAPLSDPDTQKTTGACEAGTRNSGVSQANVWREPHGGSVASTPAGCTRRGSPITAKRNHGNTRQNVEFARQLRPARVHQPADADRSPVNSRALPKSASSRTRTTWPRQLFVHRSNRWGYVGLTNGAVGGDRFVRERGCLDRGRALTAWEDGGSAVLQAGSSRAGPWPAGLRAASNRPATHRNRHPRMSSPRTINTRTKQP